MHSFLTRPSDLCSALQRLPMLTGALVLGMCLAAAGLPLHTASAQTVFTVDATGDAADANVGNSTCATSNGDCTLRAALQEANATPNSGGTDEIEFDIAGSAPHIIQPSSALPAISDPVIIDAKSQPDYSDSPVVVLDGQNAGAGVAGLTLTRASSVQALAIINFDGDGLVLDGTFSSTIQSNYIGVAADSTGAGNGGNGLVVENGASSNLIGPDNVIANNLQRGIFIGLSGADDNTVYGNLIGTSPEGMSDMGNGFEGVLLNNVTGTTIGGTNVADRNVIGGNGRAGIHITNTGATSNTVSGNYIGVAADGETALGNEHGIELTNGASNNTIGGTTSGAGNVLSGNEAKGLLITDTNSNGTADNTVVGNVIGTNAAGTAAVANGGRGIDIQNGSVRNTIGGTSSGATNVIAGNTGTGINIDGSSDTTTVQGNFVGTNASGDDLGNLNGIEASSDANTIGGTTDGAENVVGNNVNGIWLSGGAADNVVRGNYVGTDSEGRDLGNQQYGIWLSPTSATAPSGNTIGETATGTIEDADANVIAHNGIGVLVDVTSGQFATENAVRGNRIFANTNLGIDLGDDGQTPNDAGDADDGPNRLQNAPELQDATYDAGANEVTVTYHVPSDPSAGGSGASAYDLTVDFYRADADQEEGAVYLGTDTYSSSSPNEYAGCGSPPCTDTTTFTPTASVSEEDSLLATATDANGNTSEFNASAESLGPNVFTVDATGDAGDANAGDGTCATSGGECTLRAALQETNALANASAGPDEVRFDISGPGPHRIEPQSPLPDVTDPVVIDGGTEPDFAGEPVVALDGSNLSLSEDGLALDTGSGGSSVLDLSLINIPSGIAIFIRTDDNLVDGCWVGLAPDGTVSADAAYGVRIFGSSNQIGDPNGQGNVIVGASTAGVDLSNSSGPGNAVQNNLLGETPSGTEAGNASGVIIGLGGGGVENTVGGVGSNQGNLLSHSTGAGVLHIGGSSNTIRGNRIFDSSGLGIDLEDDGQTVNDAGDPDDGPNRLQNFPEIQSASYDASANEVTVTYQVPSDPNETGNGASAYDLTVDFYRTGAAQEEGEAYLGTDTYTTSDYNTSTSGPDPKTVTFTPAASVTESDHVVATATDANGNTSEFSSQSHQLPVELTSLEAAQAGDRAVDITWRAASEQNNAGFAVQHQSSSSDTWTKLGFVESKAPGGTTTESQTYRYSAEDLAVGTHRFRLKQVDLDGSTSLTDPVTVELRMDETLQLSSPAPNPVRGQASLSFAVKNEAETVVTLYNVLGQRVQTLYDGRPPAGEAQRLRLDASGLSSGMYIVRLQALGQTRTRRVTVVR